MSKVSRTTEVIFGVGLIVKGVDSVFEVIGGWLLAMPMKLSGYLLVLSQHESYRHHDALAGRLDRLADAVLQKASMGEAAYLMVHGAAKVALIIAILRGQRWGYLGLIGVLALFSSIECARAFTAHEPLTALLGVFDVVMIVVIAKEYRARFGGSG